MLILQPNKPIALCSDHAGYATKMAVIDYLKSQGIAYKDFGTYSVESGECYPGIGICGSGEGINMTLNKHQGIRSALCWTSEIASLARRHNDANVLALPGRFLSNDEAIELVKVFLSTDFEGGRHQRRIDKIPVAD